MKRIIVHNYSYSEDEFNPKANIIVFGFQIEKNYNTDPTQFITEVAIYNKPTQHNHSLPD